MAIAPQENTVLPGTSRSDLNLGNFELPPGFSSWRRSHRVSELASKTLTAAPSEEVSQGGKFLAQAGFVHKTGAGLYSLLPLGMRVIQKLETHIRAAMDDLGSQEIKFPVLQPAEFLKQTGRWGVDVLFKLEGRGDKEFALAFTHEEACAKYLGDRIQSHRDLPVSIYQLAWKYRDEPRARSGLIRCKEFEMKDMYSAHPDQASLDAYYDLAHLKYMQLYKLFGLGDVTYLTFASGGDYAPFSHEYQAVCDIGEDTIYICDDSGVAINKEIFEQLNGKCPVSGSTNFRDVRSVEVGNIFKLGTRFTDAYGNSFVGADNQNHPIFMASYGIGVTRVMATVAELLSDKNGLKWPAAIAPYDLQLIGLARGGSETEKTEQIYQELNAAGLEVLFDDRDSLSAGAKFKDSDLIGLPFRLVVSNKTISAGSVEIKGRGEQAPRLVPLAQAISEIKAGKVLV